MFSHFFLPFLLEIRLPMLHTTVQHPEQAFRFYCTIGSDPKITQDAELLDDQEDIGRLCRGLHACSRFLWQREKVFKLEWEFQRRKDQSH